MEISFQEHHQDYNNLHGALLSMTEYVAFWWDIFGIAEQWTHVGEEDSEAHKTAKRMTVQLDVQAK
jgi:hypothetical protein